MNKIFNKKEKKYTAYKPSNRSYLPPPSLIDDAHIGESPSVVHQKQHNRGDSLKHLFHPNPPPHPHIPQDTLNHRRRSASAPQPSPILENGWDDHQNISNVLHQAHLLDLERNYWQRLGNSPLARSSNSISRHFSNTEPLNRQVRQLSPKKQPAQKYSSPPRQSQHPQHSRKGSTSSTKSSLAHSQSLSVPSKPLEIHLARSQEEGVLGCGRVLSQAWTFNKDKENTHPNDLHLRVETSGFNLHISNQGKDSVNVLRERDRIRIDNGQVRDDDGYGYAYGAQTVDPSPSTSQVGLAVTSSSPAPPGSSHMQSAIPATPTPTPTPATPTARSVATSTDEHSSHTQNRRIVIPQRGSSKRYSPSKSIITGSEYTKTKLRRRGGGVSGKRSSHSRGSGSGSGSSRESAPNSSSRSMSATSSRSMAYDTYLAYHAVEKGNGEESEVNDSLANRSIASDVATLDHRPPPSATLLPGVHSAHGTHVHDTRDSSNTNSTSSVMEELRDAPLPPIRTGDIMQASRGVPQASLTRPSPAMGVDVSHTSDAHDAPGDFLNGEDSRRRKGEGRSREVAPAVTITLPPQENTFTDMHTSPNPPSRDIDHPVFLGYPLPTPPIPRKSPRRRAQESIEKKSYTTFTTHPIPRRWPEEVGVEVGVEQMCKEKDKSPEAIDSGASPGASASGWNAPESANISTASRSHRAINPSVDLLRFVHPPESGSRLALDVEMVNNKLRSAERLRNSGHDEHLMQPQHQHNQHTQNTQNTQHASQTPHPFANSDANMTFNTPGDSLSKRLSTDAYLNSLNMGISKQCSGRLGQVAEDEGGEVVEIGNGDGENNKEDLFYKPRTQPQPIQTNTPMHTPTHSKRYHAHPSMSSTGSNISPLSSQSENGMRPKASMKELEEMLRSLKMRRERNKREESNQVK
ncbi:hypothetical protein E3P77_00161 [Wallemia ichthyophaga]|nr:hypothetical protein E3P77_00161 [Wallemia ichthyophaga]